MSAKILAEIDQQNEFDRHKSDLVGINRNCLTQTGLFGSNPQWSMQFN